MRGRTVVIIILVGVTGLASLMWWIAYDLRSQVEEQAARYDLPRLTAQEAALQAARDDRFGLPSRLENAPPRDIEKYRTVGTMAHPLPPTAEGIERLLESRAISVEVCRKSTRPERNEGERWIEVDVVVGHHSEYGVVSSLRIHDKESVAWTAFERCLTGALRSAVFMPPVDAAARHTIQVDLFG